MCTNVAGQSAYMKIWSVFLRLCYHRATSSANTAAAGSIMLVEQGLKWVQSMTQTKSPHHPEPDQPGVTATAHLLPISVIPERKWGNVMAWVQTPDQGRHDYNPRCQHTDDVQ